MLDGRRSRNHQDVRRALEKPGNRNLHGRGIEARRDVRQGGRLQRVEPTEWKERHIGDALRGKVIDESIVVPVCHVVEILHAYDLGNGLSLSELRGTDVAQTDVADQPLTFKLGEHTQWLPDRSLRRSHHSANSKVHDVQSVEAEIS